MSVPYEKACESAESPETPQELLARLLARALNSFELSDDALGRLETALASSSSLHSAHHSAGLHRLIHRHTWLLADGSTFTLWELVHNTVPGAPDTPVPHARQWPDRYDLPTDQYELYTGEEELRAAVARLPLPPDEPVISIAESPFPLPLTPVPLPRHSYVPDNSADHARRLLRRAENADRPDNDTLRLLGTAFAHQITQVFGHPTADVEARLWYSLYEHAFLLADGHEVSLWEVEHTATPDGRHMCEVYATENAAHEAMERRASRSN